jgi:pimeloyl-ACP methyl ester carboxylesterase
MDYDTDFTDETASTSMGNLHFRHHAGNGAQVVFLHGLGASAMVWKRLVAYLPDDYDVYLMDLLGHGQSDAPTDMQYTVSNQYQALSEFMALQNNGNSILFGHSYGGWIATFYAANPTGCRGIILEDAAGLKEMFDKVKDMGEEGIRQYKEELVKEAMTIAGNREYVIRSVVDADITEDQLDDELLGMITRPTMILWGGEDKIVSPKYAEAFKSKIKGSEVHIIEGAGHYAHFTNPEEVAKYILDFTNKDK